MYNPFNVTLYNKSFGFVAQLNDYVSLTATPRHNQIGTADIEVTSDHRRGAALDADGSRAVITYEGEHLMSGYLLSAEGEGPAMGGTTTYHLTDDVWLLWRMLGWPVPSASDPFGTQGVKKDTRTGPAETVLKAFVAANKAHLVDNITVAPTHNWGSTINAACRMDILADVLLPLIDTAGIGVSVRQSGTGLTVDCYQQRTFAHTLSEASGTILSWKWSKATPKITNAVTGGANEGTSREFRRVRDTTREAALGYTIEQLVDAQSAENYTEQDQAGTDALVAGGPTGGFSVTLSQSKNFRYGGARGVRVGDLVTVDIGGRTRTDVLREVQLSFNRDAGLQITPAVGERTDDPDRVLYNFVSLIGRGLRKLATR